MPSLGMHFANDQRGIAMHLMTSVNGLFRGVRHTSRSSQWYCNVIMESNLCSGQNIIQ